MSPRMRAQDRLPQLVDAAISVFTREGYRAAQMADISRAMGVSEAALYRYIDSKEGLFGLAVRQALLLEDVHVDRLPLASPPLEVTLKDIRAKITGGAGFRRLHAALRQRRVDDPRTELEGIIREFFAFTVLTRHAIDMIERSAREMPELAQLFDVELRRPVLQLLSTYLERRARQGHLRATPDSWATARLVVETVTYFARHRFFDEDGATISNAVAEETVVDVLVHGLLPVPVHSESADG